MSKDSKFIYSVTKLTSSNYATWKGEIKAYLRVKGLWLLVNGIEVHHSTDTDAQAKWDAKADKAAGELYLATSNNILGLVSMPGMTSSPSGSNQISP